MPFPDPNDSGIPTDIIHLIWFGDHIPIHYEMNIIRWVENNPKHLVYVHVGLNRENIQQFNHRFLRFTSTGRLKFLDFLETLETITTELATTTEEHNLIKDAQHYLLEELIQPLGNLAAASDIYRILLLYFYGGWYVDLDLTPELKNNLTNKFTVDKKYYLCISTSSTYSCLPLAKDHLLKFGFQIYQEDAKKVICNHLIASKPKSLLIKIILQHLIKNYQQLMIGMSRSIEAYFSFRQQNLRHWIIYVTGPNAIVEALGEKGDGSLEISDPEYFIPPRIIQNIKLNYDHTWLPHGISAMKLQELKMRVAAYKMQRLFRENKISSKA